MSLQIVYWGGWVDYRVVTKKLDGFWSTLSPQKTYKVVGVCYIIVSETLVMEWGLYGAELKCTWINYNCIWSVWQRGSHEVLGEKSNCKPNVWQKIPHENNWGKFLKPKIDGLVVLILRFDYYEWFIEEQLV